MDETYGTYVDDECFDTHDYDDDTDDDTDADTEDDARAPVYYQSSRQLFLGPWSLVLKIR